MKKKHPIYWAEKTSTYSPYAFTQLSIREGYCYLIYADAISEGDAFGNTIWALPTSDSKILLKCIRDLIKTHHIVSVIDVKYQAESIKAMWRKVSVRSRSITPPSPKTLEERLIAAIENEDYEEAATLRDEINSIKNVIYGNQSMNNNNDRSQN